MFCNKPYFWKLRNIESGRWSWPVVSPLLCLEPYIASRRVYPGIGGMYTCIHGIVCGKDDIVLVFSRAPTKRCARSPVAGRSEASALLPELKCIPISTDRPASSFGFQFRQNAEWQRVEQPPPINFEGRFVSRSLSHHLQRRSPLALRWSLPIQLTHSHSHAYTHQFPVYSTSPISHPCVCVCINVDALNCKTSVSLFLFPAPRASHLTSHLFTYILVIANHNGRADHDVT
ncbi:hypothetical protein BC832DRAFT_349764 [Gaertneriomyces semiglobifer]|nr:hypothetical protein BC832DRAFT_349764 [Gaertneriomyces semiglobifer]